MEEISGISSEETADSSRPVGWSFTHMWTTLDVGRFIRDIGYPRYSKCFMDNMINGQDFKELSAFDLQRIGVHNMLDAMRIHIIIKRAANGIRYNFEEPDQPPNVSYINNGLIGSTTVPFAEPFYMEPIKPSDLRLPYRDSGSQYRRYHMTGPTINHQRSICTRKVDNTMADATLHNK